VVFGQASALAIVYCSISDPITVFGIVLVRTISPQQQRDKNHTRRQNHHRIKENVPHGCPHSDQAIAKGRR
jgi:hypothetical protein